MATLQYAGVAALDAEGEDVERHVRPCLIDHTYHSERHTHPAQVYAVGERAVLDLLADRAGECRDMTQV